MVRIVLELAFSEMPKGAAGDLLSPLLFTVDETAADLGLPTPRWDAEVHDERRS